MHATNLQKLRSIAKRTIYDFDPGVTTEVEVAWVDMRDFESLLVGFFRTIGTSAFTLRLMANTAANGSGTDVNIKTLTITAEPNAVGDYIWVETSAAEIAQAAAEAGVDGVRYITAVASVATDTDEGVFYYERGRASFPQDALTADSVA